MSFNWCTLSHFLNADVISRRLVHMTSDELNVLLRDGHLPQDGTKVCAAPSSLHQIVLMETRPWPCQDGDFRITTFEASTTQSKRVSTWQNIFATLKSVCLVPQVPLPACTRLCLWKRVPRVMVARMGIFGSPPLKPQQPNPSAFQRGKTYLPR